MKSRILTVFLLLVTVAVTAQVTAVDERSPFSNQKNEMYDAFTTLNANDALLEDRLDSITKGTVGATSVVVTDAGDSADNNFIVFVNDAEADGTVSLDSDSAFYFTPSTGIVTATGFTIGSAAIAEAELEIIDGATITTAQLNRAALFDTVYVMVTVNMALLNPSDTATATEGMIYYDADDDTFYGRNSSAWVALDTQ